jgi:phosphomannomutase
LEKADISEKWRKFFKENFDFDNSSFTVVVDPANTMGILEIETLKQFEPNLNIHTIFDEFDYTCPNHEANPIKFETLESLGEEVRKTKANIGIAFDGDADRVGFVDENGIPVPADVIGAIISRYLIESGEGSEIVYTPTCTKSVKSIVESSGGKTHLSEVGRTSACKIMRDTGAVLGMETSGHFFFKATSTVEGGVLPLFYVLKEMERQEKKLSEIVDEIVVYHKIPEINSSITLSIEEIYRRLKEKYSDGKVTPINDLRIDYDDWWFDLHPSTNDPVIRLNLEADTKELMEEKTKEILEIVRATE